MQPQIHAARNGRNKRTKRIHHKGAKSRRRRRSIEPRMRTNSEKRKRRRKEISTLNPPRNAGLCKLSHAGKLEFEGREENYWEHELRELDEWTSIGFVPSGAGIHLKFRKFRACSSLGRYVFHPQ